MSNKEPVTQKPRNLLTPVLFLIPGGFLAYIFYPTFAWMVDRWTAADSYYGHGFFIPLLTLYWVFKKRKALAKSSRPAARPSMLGLGLLIAGAALQIVSSILRIYFLSGFAFVILVFAAVELIWGFKITKKLWFPLGFLTLMIPLPLLAISQITLKMKFWVSAVATALVNHSGIQAVRQGSYIYTKHAVLLVADPCSGLRSFLAFLCLGLVFAYESKFPFWKRAILVISGLPLALISNVGRVYFMTMVGEIYGMQYTKGFVHDAAGIAAFVVAFLAFMIIRGLLEGKKS